ncbi:MAG: hypothetical protein KBD51_03740 [Candidatus Levybacteria bacterium]|nr:hypothetical protein [Candidatus Levybacteria bacterium]
MEDNSNNIVKKNKLNKTWLLVAGLVILTVVLLVVSLTSKNFSPLRSTPKEVKVDFAHTSLAVSEDVRQSPDGGYETDVIINTYEDEISGAQIELSFDPKVLTNVDIEQGTFINSPAVLIKTVDTKTGVIRYAIAIKPGDKMVKGEGVIATISFNKTGTTPTNLNFLPQSQVSTTAHSQSLLRETTSAVISVESASGAGAQTTPQISN